MKSLRVRAAKPASSLLGTGTGFRLLGHVVEDGGGVGVVGGQQEALRQLGLVD